MKKLLLLLSIVFVTITGYGQATGYVLPNFASSGSIGTASTTVDVYSRININQTTPSITLTVPPPTNTSTKVVEVWIGNKGTVSFTLRSLPDINGFVVDTGQAVILKWIGAKYVVIGKGGTGGSTIIAEAPLSYINDTLKIDTTKVPYFSGGISGPKNSITYLNGVGVWDTISAGGVLSVTGTTNRITSTGGATPVIDISSSYVGQSSITTLGTIGTGVWNAGAITSSGAITGLNFQATGSGGSGYLRLPFQTTAPTAVSGSMILYADGSNRFSIVRRNNANSADITRTHIYPDASYDWTFPTPASGSNSTLAGLNTSQTFTSVNTFTGNHQVDNLWIKNFSGIYSRTMTSATFADRLEICPTSAPWSRIDFLSGTIAFSANTLAFSGSGSIQQLATINGRNTGLTLTTFNHPSDAPQITVKTVNVNNSTTVGTGNILNQTGDITGTSTTNAFNTGSFIWEIGSTVGTGKRGNVQWFGGNSLVNFQGMERGMYIGNRTAAATGNPTSGFYMWGESGDPTFRSSGGGITSIGTAGVSMQVAGQGLLIKEGTNATLGTATLVGGTITINTTKVTANSRIFVTIQTAGGTVGTQYVSARTAGTSFDITSTSGTDTSTIAWFIVEPN